MQLCEIEKENEKERESEKDLMRVLKSKRWMAVISVVWPERKQSRAPLCTCARLCVLVN